MIHQVDVYISRLRCLVHDSAIGVSDEREEGTQLIAVHGGLVIAVLAFVVLVTKHHDTS